MKIIATHDGKFHADDVCAVAALSLLLDGPIEVVRTRDMSIIDKADYVVDVGGIYDPKKNRFDHHQEGGAGVRENGIPYASFGLVWKAYGEDLCGSKKVTKKIEEEMVMPIDGSDNGVDLFDLKFKKVKPYGLDSVVNAFVSTWKESSDMDIPFAELVRFVKALLAREIMKERAREEAEEFVLLAYKQSEDKRIVVLDGPYPARAVLLEFPEPLYFIRPHSGGNWSVEAVRDDLNSFVNRKDLPKEWGGKRDQDLIDLTGVSDATFCHKNLFIAIAKSKEGAIELAKIAVEA